jgi:hypothetical protein
MIDLKDSSTTPKVGKDGKVQKPIKVKVKCNFQFSLPEGQKQPSMSQLQAPVNAIKEFFPSLPDLF